MTDLDPRKTRVRRSEDPDSSMEDFHGGLDGEVKVTVKDLTYNRVIVVGCFFRELTKRTNVFIFYKFYVLNIFVFLFAFCLLDIKLENLC